MNQAEAIAIVKRAQRMERITEDPSLVKEAVETLVAATCNTYSRMSTRYSQLRNDQPSEWDMVMINLMVREVCSRVADGRIAEQTNRWTLLDIGAGHGRDLEFFSKLKNCAPVGIENNDEFLKILVSIEKAGRIPPRSYMKADMRHLDGISSNSITCVRNHATLHHLPLLWKGVGVDEAISETQRVLKRHGMFYVLVKQGNELELIDTNEGLGPRLFQLFTKASLSSVLSRNGFTIIHLEERTELRPSGNVEWVFALAEKD